MSTDSGGRRRPAVDGQDRQTDGRTPTRRIDAYRQKRPASVVPNSHRHTRHDKMILSVSCLVCRCELDDRSERVRTSNFLSATVLSCPETNSHRRSGRDADKTVLLCLAWLYKYGSMGSMCAHTHSERHLDRFSRFSTATFVTNRHTDRQTDRTTAVTTVRILCYA